MKNFILDFLRRGMPACGIGPLVLAVVYWILYRTGAVETLTVSQVCIGILSLSALAFVAAGMNALYRIERLPLMIAIFIHGCVLYVSYLGTYLLNGWLQLGIVPILIFSGVFIVGYLVIWVVVYSGIKKKTDKLNTILKKKQQQAGDIS